MTAGFLKNPVAEILKKSQRESKNKEILEIVKQIELLSPLAKFILLLFSIFWKECGDVDVREYYYETSRFTEYWNIEFPDFDQFSDVYLSFLDCNHNNIKKFLKSSKSDRIEDVIDVFNNQLRTLNKESQKDFYEKVPNRLKYLFARTFSFLAEKTE